ncbi:hypothetical protein [Actinokineospora iranica]|uniref:Tissue inhibitor of metalloproteinase n=1 Tax=Actinokineospora iranica TaxID=1271860 RepID=A0A1G6RXZ5_9PSEU|nr:hypothetical protein [Actinokineospora iranica]SDD09323.1 hypothetical protein SAMN05216174_10787 [Actinokineospora iranica]
MSPFHARRDRRLGRVLAVIALAATMLVGLFVTSASACSCFPGGEGSKYQRAQHVFEGLVISETLVAGDPEETRDDKRRYLVLRLHSYKGSAPILVNVETYVETATCGTKLIVWEKYVVFATGDPSDFVIETGLCSGNRLAEYGPPITVDPPTTTTTPPPTTTTTGPLPTALGAVAPSPCAVA